MPDICTLALGLATTVLTPAIGCFQQECAADPLGSERLLCMPKPCVTELPPLTYECKRDDGTTYLYTAPNNSGTTPPLTR